MNYTELSPAALKAERAACEKKLQTYTERGVALDLTRGKPAPEQLALSMGMLDVLDAKSVTDSESGMDCRNYGGPDGIPEARRLLRTHAGDAHGKHHCRRQLEPRAHVPARQPRYDRRHLRRHARGASVEHRKFLCPAPGYDRHFAITEHFGFELIPDSHARRRPGHGRGGGASAGRPHGQGHLVRAEVLRTPPASSISDAVVRRFAELRPAAEDFRIFWDNAYCIHDFGTDTRKIPDLLTLCEAAGNPDLVYEFCSTSKISFPGGGISAVAASPANLIDIKTLSEACHHRPG